MKLRLETSRFELGGRVGKVFKSMSFRELMHHHYKKTAAALAAALLCGLSIGFADATNTLVISSKPLHAGRISPMLFGNFIELLDDLVPGMWAEMLNDRSFEGVTRPANWCYYDGQPSICDREWETNATWRYETSGAFNGNRCIKLAREQGRSARITQSGLAVKKGAEYLLSGYFRTDRPNSLASVSVKTALPNGEWQVLASERLPTLTTEWKKYTVKLKSSGETDRAVFELSLGKNGTLWADKLSLMPVNNLHGWRPDVIAAVKEAHPAVLRWGGSVCDPGEYRWKKGIGDRDARTPFPNKVWGRIDSNDVGIDEFCQFCELTEARPLICLSFSDGAQSAADLIEYCNGSVESKWGGKRAANGHASPYRVSYWQIGNEIGGDDPTYLNAVTEFCRKMKEADPSIACMASFPSQKLLDRVRKDVAYIGPHHYTPDFAACEQDFLNLGRMVQDTPGCAQMKIAVTEWNISAGSWGLMRGKLLTLETALLNARYLNLLIRHSDKVEIACRSNLANSFGSGIIETTPSSVLKRPSYYVMKLYADHMKPLPLTIQKPIEGLDTVACSSEDGSSIVVFMVNSKPEPVQVTPVFETSLADRRSFTARAVCDSQDARQLDVMDHWSAPNRVGIIDVPVIEEGLKVPAYSVTVLDLPRRDLRK